MNVNAKLEPKIVRTLVKFLANDKVLIPRWGIAGRALTFAGSFFVVITIWAYWQGASASWLFSAIAGAAGVCLGLGLWFTTFAAQWPVVRQFLDADRVHRRMTELSQVPPN